MANPDIHLNNIGVQFLTTMKDQDGNVLTDLNLLTTKHFVFTKPDESKAIRDGSFYTDGTDGKLIYVTLNGDLDQTGIWNFQVVIVYNDGKTYSSDIERFVVLRNL